jgi:hypothetical protein
VPFRTPPRLQIQLYEAMREIGLTAKFAPAPPSRHAASASLPAIVQNRKIGITECKPPL